MGQSRGLPLLLLINKMGEKKNKKRNEGTFNERDYRRGE
jgi:hypothetical protein